MMHFTSSIKQALDRATQLHMGQYRKGTDLPFIVHPYSVASIVSEYTDDEQVVIAALLHDVLEEVPSYTAKDLADEFGQEIADIVERLTEHDGRDTSDQSLRDSWQRRKEAYLDQLRTADERVLLVACADKIHNLWSILDEYEQYGDDLWGEFRTPNEKKLWLFEEVLAIAKERLKSPIVRELEALYAEARDRFRSFQPEVESVPVEELSRILADEFRRTWKPVKYWLMKTEPDTYSIDDLEHDKKTPWGGVRNYQARNFIRDKMKPGDMVLIYHSNAKPSGIVGVAKVVSNAYSDPTAFDPKSQYYDPKSSPENPTWFVADIGFVRRFEHIISLEALKKNPKLSGMLVTRKGDRLSVQPVTKQHLKDIENMA